MRIPGFQFSSIQAGIRYKNRPDLCLIFSDVPANICGVFTKNNIKAAPVIYAMEKLSSNMMGQAIIINSGNANACTGQRGLEDVREMINITAKELGIDESLIYPSSTGVIGEPMPMERIKKSIPELVRRLSYYGIEGVAEAIMTTDTFPKHFTTHIEVDGKRGTIGGVAKGAGMINPNMATMLCFIMTDISVEHGALKRALRDVVENSFNKITVDGDMSTNDTVMIMSNGLLNNDTIDDDSNYYPVFKDALFYVSYRLSKMIVEDGEGATKLIEVFVRGGESSRSAERIARAVANSNLVKTAIYGEDPNWGRIIAAVGYAGVEVIPDRINISINGVMVAEKGVATGLEDEAKEMLKEKYINIMIDLCMGSGEAKILTCDLTEDYIKINAGYRT
ncbi:MAG: bifunctional glutamate N-acetyltransferase/amino-acid acetyltransferase ArgJ [Nitrospirae bacterium]|nr:MAG: bifunctional glutamate N-acetyltransferase/amino-acid acetyltransferase ArgJ [Nitrospirota bacterium]